MPKKSHRISQQAAVAEGQFKLQLAGLDHLLIHVEEVKERLMMAFQ
jgi:hypothetical protein